MPHTHQPDPTSRPPVMRICPACGRDRMRLVLVRPSSHFVNLDECTYRCDCGEEAEYVMMRPEPD
jgi:lysyl-tRNA synthetase class I